MDLINTKIFILYIAISSILVFKTLVNNAGVMVFGEFSWQTDNQIQNQIGVNLVGVMNVTRTFLPHIRRNKGITVSHPRSIYDEFIQLYVRRSNNKHL